MSHFSRKIRTRFVKDEITFNASVAWVTVDSKNATPTTHVSIIRYINLVQSENMLFMTKMNDISLFINYLEWIFDFFFFFGHIFEL
ncbi:transmembrane protein [Arabidopsis thaliana]|uniref:Transmembrane protein n=1 Tax=Arabidopsis thaliana TaxID=3702 RepID=A0A1P8BEU5_ARATH|nr:uncharacterized protein AT5G54043 [Arabidopsis thaliana]ANM70115.1 transmembrane protein [Arabidopsis thaliana]|eukprot:NP_001331748.1 transmembrane protein [Arabidopsis thaliana]